jgi:hypothetical protein
VTRRGRVLAQRRAKDRDAPPPSLGGQMVEWMGEFLVHGPGEVQGQPLVLHEDLVLRLWRMLELDANGLRSWREAVVADVKGVGKTEFGAAFLVGDCMGPALFDGFDASGNPVGRPRESADAVVLATSLDQADRTAFSAAAFMVDPARCRPEFLDEYGAADVGRGWESCTRIVFPGRGSIAAFPTNDAAVEGGKETLVVFEETHLWLEQGQHALFRRISRNMAKRPDTMALQLSNWFGPGEGSLLESSVQAIEAGAPNVLLLARQIPVHLRPAASKELRLLGDAELLRLLKLTHGSARFVPLRSVMSIIRDPRTPDHEARRFYLNISAKATAGVSWVTASQWDALASPLEFVDGQEIVAGIDASTTGDSTAVVACGWVAGRIVVRARIWPGVRGQRIPRDQVEQHLRDLAARYSLRSAGYDPKLFERSALDLADEGLLMVEVPQSLERMQPLCREAQDEIRSGAIAHDGDPVLGEHVVNAVPKFTERGFSLSKMRSVQRIDGAVALVLALGELRAPAPADDATPGVHFA